MKCPLCGHGVLIFGNVTWCDDCIDEFLDRNDRNEDMTAFVARKKKSNGLETPLALHPAFQPS
jgi:hypothetical protein